MILRVNKRKLERILRRRRALLAASLEGMGDDCFAKCCNCCTSSSSSSHTSSSSAMMMLIEYSSELEPDPEPPIVVPHVKTPTLKSTVVGLHSPILPINNGEQGGNGYFYGYYKKVKTTREFSTEGMLYAQNGFIHLPSASAKFTPISGPLFMQPGAHATPTVRRWVSDINSQIIIEGDLRKYDAKGGEGVLLMVYHNNIPVYTNTIGFNYLVGKYFKVSLKIKRSDKIDFVITSIGKTNIHDGTILETRITPIKES